MGEKYQCLQGGFAPTTAEWGDGIYGLDHGNGARYPLIQYQEGPAITKIIMGNGMLHNAAPANPSELKKISLR